jgi:hypothetical protein
MMYIQTHLAGRVGVGGATLFEQEAVTQDVESLERYIWLSQEYDMIRYHMN